MVLTLEAETNEHLFLLFTMQANCKSVVHGKEWAEEGHRRIGGNTFQQAYGGLCERKTLKAFLKTSNHIQKIKMNCLTLLYFWCKRERMGNIEDLVDFLGEVESFVFNFCSPQCPFWTVNLLVLIL